MSLLPKELHFTFRIISSRLFRDEYSSNASRILEISKVVRTACPGKLAIPKEIEHRTFSDISKSIKDMTETFYAAKECYFSQAIYFKSSIIQLLKAIASYRKEDQLHCKR
jgi:hypothetical protein